MTEGQRECVERDLKEKFMTVLLGDPAFQNLTVKQVCNSADAAASAAGSELARYSAS